MGKAKDAGKPGQSAPACISNRQRWCAKVRRRRDFLTLPAQNGHREKCHRKGGLAIVQIVVRDNNVDQALRALKKKMQREGIFREMKLRGHFEKPSEKRAREKAEAVRRARKLARKRAQREGLR